MQLGELEKHKYWPFKSFYKINLNISEKETEQIKLFVNNFKNSVDADQTTTYKKVNVLNLPLLKNLRNKVIKVIESLNLVLDNNWAQLYRKGDRHAPHAHYLSEYSGIIYIDGDTQEGTNFISPVGAGCYSTKFNKNDLILFPSHILHFVDVQKDNTNRIVISFNTLPKGGFSG
jgi:hypothetical protein